VAIPPDIRAKMRAALEANRQGLESGEVTMADVAAANGLTPHLASMYHFASALDISKRAGRPPVIDHALVIALYAEGMSVAEIQRRIGHKNRQAIDKIIKPLRDDKLKK